MTLRVRGRSLCCLRRDVAGWAAVRSIPILGRLHGSGRTPSAQPLEFP